MFKNCNIPARYQKYIIAFFMDVTLTIIFAISAYASAFFGFENLNNVSLTMLAVINAAFIIFALASAITDADLI